MKKEYVKKRVTGFWLKVFEKLAPELNEACSDVGSHVPCPSKEHKNSVDGFRLFDDAEETGGGICNTCGSFSDGFALLMWLRSWKFKKVLSEVSKCLDTLDVPERSIEWDHKEKSEKRKTVNSHAQERINITLAKADFCCDRVRKYLKSRGLSGNTKDLLYHESVKYYEKSDKSEKYLGAMIAQVVNSEDQVISLHYTYLSYDHPGKADVESPKKFAKSPMKGILNGAAIILGEISETMGVAEGIETALAVQETMGGSMLIMPANLQKNMYIPEATETIEIWADNDRSGAGEKAADELAGRLLDEGKKVFFMMPPKKGEDWLDVLNDPEQGPDAFLQTKETKLEYQTEDESTDRLPLLRKKDDALPFPIHSLGKFLGETVKALSELTQAPEALCAQGLLAAATLSVQGHANVDIDGRIKPISNFFFTIGESGERKSAVDDICLKPHREHESFLRSQLKQKMNDYKVRKKMYDAAFKQILEDDSLSDEMVKEAAHELGLPPEKPLQAGMLVDDPTIEGLGKFLIEEQPSIGIFSDEGGKFIGGYSMSVDNQLKTIAGLSQLWDGKPLKSIRVSTGNTFVVGKRVSIHLMMQGVIAEKVLSDQLMKSQGFLSRILICQPESKIGTRKYKVADKKAHATIKEYHNHVQALLRKRLPFKKDLENELDPRPISLSEDAKRVFIDFYNRIEHSQQENEEFFNIRGFASKAPEHATRIAAVLTLFEDIDAQVIDEKYMKNGIALMDYFLSEAKRQIDADDSNDDLMDAKNLLTWMQARGEQHPIITIYQSGPMKIRNAKRARDVMAILEEHGWVKNIGETEIEGISYKEVWALI
ncbi:hypothetical protein DO021_20505 [Desulfobacter hydrogenophilus]|uniref:DUF3987 domain-containing protein n=1 Tax=Desulfobacter hydrogenophilus TaxID=2291 RepID=A0A328F6P8_9BACT|nr:DUF3987 domain-containing protein [Desulfobacter hydrogenophilus]NDY74255.1 DUF3987 domain-containing protein [Desulfobacter hydrogenophilus]QBH14569.1 DUF3987 domain-containing protein [Desulfobacter hydrogenophilus]RAM00178.1 hypothetical protein DO021_20505 [Desulfobacter hydrogenophilus]